MAKITYDGQSFLLDQRRIWLVSGTLHYSRMPRGLWASRIRAARQAGLNCVEVPLVWSVHEPQPGRLDFTGDRDLRHFVELIAEQGMFCVLRPGPFAAGDEDQGGLPTWLHNVKPDRRSGPMRFREGNGPYLSGVSRYFSGVMNQVKDLQVTSPIGGSKPAATPTLNAADRPAGGFVGQGGGPIIMMHVEQQWYSGNDDQDAAYHQQLIRLLREGGANVPLAAGHQLWQEVDGTIHTWRGREGLTANLRQLRSVQPAAPPMVGGFGRDEADVWGRERQPATDADRWLSELAEVLAAGAQFTIDPLHGGTRFGFRGGRRSDADAAFVTTSAEGDAPLLEAGGRGPRYDATRRIATFASHFGNVLAHLQPEAQAAVVAPPSGPGGETSSVSSVCLPGGRGDLVVVFNPPAAKAKSTTLLLPNGLSLHVPLGNRAAAWLLLNAKLGGGVTLDYTNLSPLAWIEGRLLVLVGPAGAQGLVSLDDAHLEVSVPTGKTPLVQHVDQTTVLVLNDAMADASYPTHDGWVVGASEIDEQGEPQPVKGWATRYHYALDGTLTKAKGTPMRRPTAPKLEAWSVRTCEAWLDGSADGYQPLKQPTPRETLGHAAGYAWTHLQMPKSGSRSSPQILAAAPLPPAGAMGQHADDRLHIYRDGKYQTTLGPGPGTAGREPTPLRLAGSVAVLIDSPGRFADGTRLGDKTGLSTHLYAIKPAAASVLRDPVRTTEPAPDPFALGGYVPYRHADGGGTAPSLAWTLKPAAKLPMVLDIAGLPVDAVLSINEQPVVFWSARASGGFQRLLLDPEAGGPFESGSNELRLTFLDPPPADFDHRSFLTLYQATANLTAKAKWSFSPWSIPDAEAEGATPLAPGKAKPIDQPAWFETRFSIANTRCPLFVYPKGMTKGQIVLNGRNLGRYFVATRDGQAVPPQTHYYLPEPWLDADGENVLQLFDEHGHSPRDGELAYNECGPYG